MRRFSEYDRQVMRYCFAALLAAVITTGIYSVVVGGVIENTTLLAAVILVAAILQFCVQVYFFLPVRSKKGQANWRLYSLWFVILMLLIVVIGSIWVMWNLDYNMGMTPEQMHERMLKESLKGF